MKCQHNILKTVTNDNTHVIIILIRDEASLNIHESNLEIEFIVAVNAGAIR